MEKTYNKFYLLLSITAVIWGIQPVLIKISVKELTPAALTAFRYLLLSGTLFALMYYKKEKQPLPNKKTLLPLMLMGFCGILINNVAQFSGLQYSTVTNATLISSTTPAITALLAAVFLKERMIPLRWLGILLSLSGAAYLISRGSLEVILNISFNYGDILFFISQAAWAVYSLISIRVMRSLPVLTTTAWAGLFGALFTAVYGLCNNELHYAPVSLPAALSLVYIIWGGGVLAMISWNIGVKETGAIQAAIFLNIMPIVGILCGVVFLGEELRFQEIFGAAAILSGVYLTTHSEQAAHMLVKKFS